MIFIVRPCHLVGHVTVNKSLSVTDESRFRDLPGGAHSNKGRKKTTLSILASSKEDAKKVFNYISKSVGRAEYQCDIEWLISVTEQLCLRDTIVEATADKLKPRKRKPKKRYKIKAVQ